MMRGRVSRWYRFWRWWYIQVSIMGINDPDDVGPYFERREALIADRAHERAALGIPSRHEAV